MANYFRQRLAAVGHALRGLRELLRTETHARLHLLATVLVCAAGITWQVSRLEWGLLILAIGLVWTTETLNTALETAVDLASPEWHELARRAKDLSAAAVLLAAGTAVLIGLVVFLG